MPDTYDSYGSLSDLLRNSGFLIIPQDYDYDDDDEAIPTYDYDEAW